MTTTWSGPQARSDFFAALVQAGHLVPTGMPGVVGRGAAFEAVCLGLSGAESALQPDPAAVTSLTFPPVVPQSVFEGTDYVTNFPQLIGSVRVFAGNDADHAALLAARTEGDDWTAMLTGSDLMLVSAACHPIYGMLAGQRLSADLLFETVGQCFRHEPSEDPARMVSFRQHDQVIVGQAEAAIAHRDLWLALMSDLFATLGVPVRTVVADDPFFGRAGRLLKAGQRGEELKLELVADIYDDRPTAIGSGNAHLDHFGVSFDIATAAGEPAHSACFGLGLERATLALMRCHGLDVAAWPQSVRAALQL